MRINKEKLYEIVCKVSDEIDSASKNEPDIIPFKIEDYWNLSSLTNGQIDSLNTDLSVFIHGNGYGDVLQYIDGSIVCCRLIYQKFQKTLSFILTRDTSLVYIQKKLYLVMQ